MKKNIILRCDASLNIGSGHLMRCRSLARALKERSINPIFICKKNKGDLIKIISEEFDTISLKKQFDNNQSSEEYESWLGSTQEFDAKQTLDEIYKNRISNILAVIVDHYSLGVEWENYVKNGLEDFQNKIPISDPRFSKSNPNPRSQIY